jgi:ATP-dependent Lon protease
MTESPRTIGVPSGESVFPVLPLRDIVVFPHMIVPLFVGREKSINALEEVMRADKQILLATQKDAGDDDPAPESIYEIGHPCHRAAAAQVAGRHGEVLVEGRDRAQILRYTDRQNYFEAEGRILRRLWARTSRSKHSPAPSSPSSRTM